jgi:tRNA (adenine22-N1)-methyltransferase
MKKIELSKRMKVVADMVEPCQCVADIGCDHAFVSIYLAANHVASHVIASDVRPGPIEIARRNVGEWGLSDVIDIRLNDGLNGIKPGEADTIIIAGMGGMLMIDILSKNKEVASASRTLVLQPQSDIEKVRRYVISCGYIITDEDMIIDMGKYYNILKVEILETNFTHIDNSLEYNDIEYRYGRILLQKKNEVLKEYLSYTYNVNKEILEVIGDSQSASAVERRESLEKEQRMLEQARIELTHSD